MPIKQFLATRWKSTGAAVRMRPILLTAGTTLLGNWLITLDSAFSGLAWVIILGMLTSTMFILLVILVDDWLTSNRGEQPFVRAKQLA